MRSPEACDSSGTAKWGWILSPITSSHPGPVRVEGVGSAHRTKSHLAVLDMFAAERTDPMAIAAETGYRKVDATIAWTTSRAQRDA